MLYIDQSKKKYISGVTPALRPSLPAMCRKRIFCQGQALSGRFAGLDIHIRASGLKYTRATDEDASGGGSVKGYSHFRYRKAKGKIHSCRQYVACSEIHASDYQNTCQLHSTYSRFLSGQTINHITQTHIFFADTSLHYPIFLFGEIPPAQIWLAHFPKIDCRPFISGLPISCVLKAFPMLSAYRLNAVLSSVSNLPDADFSHTSFRKYAISFVRPYFRRPAYVSSIRCAYSLTAGEGQSPFEPLKAKRQKRQ